MEQALGKRKSSIDSVLEFLGERVFEESRPDKGEILESMGLSVFDPEDIARVTHGIMFHDSNWLRFDGEDYRSSIITFQLTYKRGIKR